MKLDLSKIKKVYVIGIKGSGVVAIVEILHSMGIEITGSDQPERFFTDEILRRLGIKYVEGFDPKNIPRDADLIIYSTSYNENNNPEIFEALSRNLPMVSYPEILADLFNQKYGIAVSGTHGKTTTSAMLANTLKEIGADPQAVIGSKVLNWEGNALCGHGEIFVAETDEYQDKLSLYNPKASILTSCDWDHPDYFRNFNAYKKTFIKFVKRIPKVGFLVVWGDSVDTLEVSGMAGCKVLTYGFSEGCDFKIINYKLEITNKFRVSADQILKPRQIFEVEYKGRSLGKFEIQLIGKHNVLNATAVISVCHRLNLDMQKVRAALLNFRGTARRFEYIGERNGAILIDDYAHHPEEIRSTLRAARELYPKKNIWAIFHPHTFTRTRTFLGEFAQSFSDADRVIVLDIYGSAREIQGGAHSKDIVNLANVYDYGKAKYIPTIGGTVEYLQDKIGTDDLVITIGAGNVWEVGEKLKSEPPVNTIS